MLKASLDNSSAHFLMRKGSALLTLSTNKPSSNYTDLALQTRRNWIKLENKEINTIATWVFDHDEIQENVMPKLQLVKHHSYLQIKRPSPCLKIKQSLRSIHCTCRKDLGVTTIQVVTFMIFNQKFKELTKACMIGELNLTPIDSKWGTAASAVNEAAPLNLFVWQSHFWLCNWQ